MEVELAEMMLSDKLFLFDLLQEAKKKYDKETEKYCAVLEKHLSLSARKKESHLHEVRCYVWIYRLIYDVCQCCREYQPDFS